jgi:2-polyprenyl-3-methyl-5-hydroxy-6-metoxy-1,4-benzoquinol methylase
MQRAIIVELLNALRGVRHLSVLDLGCGTGSLRQEFRYCGFRVPRVASNFLLKTFVMHPADLFHD